MFCIKSLIAENSIDRKIFQGFKTADFFLLPKLICKALKKK